MTLPGFSADLDEATGVLRVTGELDEPATVELRDAITKASEELTKPIALDLSAVTFMPSPAIGVLATSQAGARRKGADVTFIAPSGSVAGRLLTICALDFVESL